MKRIIIMLIGTILVIGMISCTNKKKQEEVESAEIEVAELVNLGKYITVELTTDLSVLSENQKKMLPLLFEAAQIMNGIYWQEAYGPKEELLSEIEDEDTRKFANINYGPWDRLEGNEAFLEKYGKKPKGANFYPKDMTKEEFDAFTDTNKTSLYTLIRRNKDGTLKCVWYKEAFKEQVIKASNLIKKAAEMAEDEGFKKYLILRAEALLTDDYQSSDYAWLEMKDNIIDFIIGPVENYEDALYGYKAAHEAFILVKDVEWSKSLEKYIKFLPELQKSLPCEEKYKSDVPGTSGSELNVYDVIYYAGDCNAGSKTIAINLPNDPVVRGEAGSRKLQLKNAMKAKFDKILVPIANVLIDESQRSHVSFDAFFGNTMFHEVGHGLGMDFLVDDKKVGVREALKDYYTSIEESKADILGLFVITKLHDMGELGEVDLMDYYVTFMSSIFRSVRFGVASSHGKANMMRFYFFQEKGAFVRDAESGTYKVNFEKMQAAMNELSAKILTIQGDGDFEKAKAWVEQDGKIKEELQKDLDRLDDLGIPRDIVFDQGIEVLGL